MDKKGVLSWPNPTAEKVFFLRNDLGSRDKWSSTSGASDGSSSEQLDSFDEEFKSVSAKNMLKQDLGRTRETRIRSPAVQKLL